MPAGLVVFLVLLTILLAAAILPWPLLARWKRRRAGLVASYAAQHGWDYRADQPDLADRFHQLPFGAGFSRRLENVLLSRLDGRPVAAFDYHYYFTGGGLGPTASGSRWFSVLAIFLGVQVPDVAINPASLKYPGFSRRRDLETGDAAFDRAFAVTTTAPGFAHDVLTPDVRALLLRYPDAAWRFDGDALLMVSPLVILRAPAVDEKRLAAARQVVAAVPPGVWDRLSPR